MAPIAPLGRDAAIARVERGELPFRFGSPHPCVMVLEQDGVFRVRGLVVDEADAHRAAEEARAHGRPFMPEHHYALAKPTGTVFAEAPSRAALAEAMRTMTWPAHW